MMSTSTWERAPWADALRKSRTDYSVRVEEAGRGRSARSPLTIPARGWKDIFWRTYTQIGDDRPLAVGAGAVFYVLLALFPAITALVSLYGLLADPATINDHLSLLLQGVMPEGVIVKEQVTRLTARAKRMDSARRCASTTAIYQKEGWNRQHSRMPIDGNYAR